MDPQISSQARQRGGLHLLASDPLAFEERQLFGGWGERVSSRDNPRFGPQCRPHGLIEHRGDPTDAERFEIRQRDPAIMEEEVTSCHVDGSNRGPCSLEPTTSARVDEKIRTKSATQKIRRQGGRHRPNPITGVVRILAREGDCDLEISLARTTLHSTGEPTGR